MAIVVQNTVNPIKISGTTSVSEEVYAKTVYIDRVYWFNPSLAGDLLSLKDKKGNDIVCARCEADNESQWLPVHAKFEEIHCDDLDSGTVYIYKNVGNL